MFEIMRLYIVLKIIHYIDVILPYLESTVDSPIPMHCNTNETSQSTGDVSVGDLFDEVSSCSNI